MTLVGSALMASRSWSLPPDVSSYLLLSASGIIVVVVEGVGCISGRLRSTLSPEFTVMTCPKFARMNFSYCIHHSHYYLALLCFHLPLRIFELVLALGRRGFAGVLSHWKRFMGCCN